MRIGFQGIKNCYSYQVLDKYMKMYIIEPIGFKSFEELFNNLKNNTIDYAILPIENSLGGSVFVNSYASQMDLFYKHEIKIHCEFHYHINHSLYSFNDNIKNISKVISHPQALLQCNNNIKKHNFRVEEFWDTTASLHRLAELEDKNIACIGPPNLGKEFGLNELYTKFNDVKKNITRFYLVSSNNDKSNDNFNKIINNNLIIENYKFSGYIIANDKVGILNRHLNYFTENKYNLTKIESRPYLRLNCANDSVNDFSYIFYIEGVSDNKCINTINNFNLFGNFPKLMFENENLSKINKQLKVGIIGFGRFGQFVGKEMIDYGFKVFATSRTDYTKIAKEYNIEYVCKSDFEELDLDIIIFATSILSFENVLKSYSKDFLKKSLLVDVLSVKQYPYEIFKEYLLDDYNLLLTHPMFGPDSANLSWNDKTFVYYVDSTDKKFKKPLNTFLDFWKYKGCNMKNMIPEEHDIETANSQFLTHFIGRTLELLECENTDIDTDGYKSLLKIKNHTVNDSWDLFYALAKYNMKSNDTINKLKYMVSNLESKIYSDKTKIKLSETSKMYKRILEMRKDGIDVINAAIGVPTWFPNTGYSSEYSTAKGNMDLIENLSNYYNNKYDMNTSSDNLMISSGAKPCIYIALKLLTKIGSKWIVPTPYWTSYPDMVSSLNGSTIILNGNPKENWEFDINQLEEHFNDTTVNGIILCNPNNPTGLVYSEKYIKNIIVLCEKYKKYIIVDEVYLPLTDMMTSYKYIENQSYDKMIVISSFSKYWAVPGWRIGWILSSKNLIEKLIGVQSCIFTCASTAGMELCNKLLIEKNKPNLSILDMSRIELENLFISKGWELIRNKNRSMYIFPIKFKIDIDSLIENLLNEGLAIISGKAFGYEQGIRVTLPNNLNTLNRMKEIFKKCLK